MAQDDIITVKVDKDLEGIVPQYLEWSRDDLVSMKAALEKGDFETLRKLGHNFKGSGGGYGFDLVTEIGAGIERLAKEKAGDEIRPLLEQLAAYFQNLQVVYE